MRSVSFIFSLSVSHSVHLPSQPVMLLHIVGREESDWCKHTHTRTHTDVVEVISHEYSIPAVVSQFNYQPSAALCGVWPR